MEFNPFTLADAEEIAEDFEDLIDTEFALDGSLYIVDGVLVAPYAEEEKKEFVERYYSSRNAAEALSAYSGSEYDVVLAVSYSADETQHNYIRISSFVVEKGISYNFPE